jgi:hypothetical protein
MNLRWLGHVARMRETRNESRILVWNLFENGYLEARERDGKITITGSYKTVSEDRTWMEVDQDRAKWRALVSVMLNIGFCYHSDGFIWGSYIIHNIKYLPYLVHLQWNYHIKD